MGKSDGRIISLSSKRKRDRFEFAHGRLTRLNFIRNKFKKLELILKRIKYPNTLGYENLPMGLTKKIYHSLHGVYKLPKINSNLISDNLFLIFGNFFCEEIIMLGELLKVVYMEFKMEIGK